MARKRVDGRFAREGAKTLDGVEGEGAATGSEVALGGAQINAPRPRYCRAFARKRMAEEMPLLMNMLLQQAREGSLGHLKILVQLCGLDRGEVTPAVKRREKSLEVILKEQWDKDAAEYAAEQRAK